MGDGAADSTGESELAVLSDAVSRGSGSGRSRSRRHYDIKKRLCLKKITQKRRRLDGRKEWGRGRIK